MTDALKSYLEYYQTLTEPKYAVLVTGPWGSGKTHQVKDIIPEGKRYYVSLFGLRKIEEVEAAILAEAFSGQDKTVRKAAKGIETLGKAFKASKGVMGGASGKLLGAVGGAVPEVLTAVMKRSMDPQRCTLIFDDLERCKLDMESRLGIINSYVEKWGFRVVVLAHDGKIIEGLEEQKEKVFGQTLKVTPQTDKAFDAFLKKMKEDGERDEDRRAGAEFVEEYEDFVLQTFRESKEGSLRILRHVMEDLGRLNSVLDDKYRQKTEGMQVLVQGFTAFDIAVRSSDRPMSREEWDRLREDFGYRGFPLPDEEAEELEDKKNPPFHQRLEKKHPGIDQCRWLFSAEALGDMLFDGRYDGGKIPALLDGSLYFRRPENLPAWRIVYEWYSQDTDVLRQALVKFDADFEERKITEPEEIEHLFALKLLMAAKGISGETVSDSKVQCEKYIQELLESGTLQAILPIEKGLSAFQGRMWNLLPAPPDECKDQFDDLRKQLADARKEVRLREMRNEASDLLVLLKCDLSAFGRLISEKQESHGRIVVTEFVQEENRYADLPILAEIDADAFVEAWLTLPKFQQGMLWSYLYNRYGSGWKRLKQEPLKGEAAWLHTVVDKVRQHAEERLRSTDAAVRFEGLNIKAFLRDEDGGKDKEGLKTLLSLLETSDIAAPTNPPSPN